MEKPWTAGLGLWRTRAWIHTALLCWAVAEFCQFLFASTLTAPIVLSLIPFRLAKALSHLSFCFIRKFLRKRRPPRPFWKDIRRCFRSRFRRPPRPSRPLALIPFFIIVLSAKVASTETANFNTDPFRSLIARRRWHRRPIAYGTWFHGNSVMDVSRLPIQSRDRRHSLALAALLLLGMDIEANPGPDSPTQIKPLKALKDTAVIMSPASSFGVTLFDSHSVVTLREVKREGAGAKAGLRVGDVVLKYREEGVTARTAAEVRAYLAHCVTSMESAHLFIRSKASSVQRPKLSLQDSTTRMSRLRDSQSSGEKKDAAKKNTYVQASLRSQRTPEKTEADRQRKNAFQIGSRSIRTPEQRACDQNANTLARSDSRQQTPTITQQRQSAREVAAKIQRDMVFDSNRALDRAIRTQAMADLRSPTMKRARTLGPHQVLASDTRAAHEYIEAFDHPLSRHGRPRDVFAYDAAEAMDAWDAFVSTDDYRPAHQHLLLHGFDVDINVLNRLTGAMLSEFGTGDVEIIPTGDVSVGNIADPPDLPLLLPTTASLSIAIVRFGSTAVSGHYVTLAVDPRGQGPIYVFDSLRQYTLESVHSPRYLQHLAKVGAVMMRRNSTARLHLSFPALTQQAAGGDSCGTYAVLYAYALIRGVNPAIAEMGPHNEVRMRQVLHDTLFTSPGYALSFHHMENILAHVVADYVPDAQPVPPQVPCPLCRGPGVGGPAAAPPLAHTSHFPSLAATTQPQAALPRSVAGNVYSTGPSPPAPATGLPASPSSSSDSCSSSPTFHDCNTKTPKKKTAPLPPKKVVLRPLQRRDPSPPRPPLTPTEKCRCPYCGAFLFAGEAGSVSRVTKQWCCGKGNYVLPPLRRYDTDFYREGIHIDREFQDKSRKLNNMAALSSLGVSGQFITPASGTSFVKIHGQTYHRIFDLSWSSEAHGPRQSQLCILDNEARTAVANSLSVSPQLTASVFSFLFSVNNLYTEYRRLSLFPHDDASIVFKATTRATDGPVLGDLPTSSEIAGIITRDADSDVRSARLWKVGNAAAHHISILDPAYEPLQFPLLRPFAEAGWSPTLTSTAGKRLTMLQYLRFHLLTERRYSDLGRLGQEYAVDMYSRVEESRLNYLRFHQPNFRMGTREEIAAALGEQADGAAYGRVYLPSSFTGGPRQMRTLFQDAMAIVAKYGAPTLFITATCNPRWPEIQPPGDPAMCARVFKLKMAELMKRLRDGSIFPGSVVYEFECREWQKRGLPHSHIVVKLSKDIPLAEVDKFISAEIPGAENPALRDIILRHNVHGPCGLANPSSPCMEAGACTKYYPKDPVPKTHEDDRGYTQYRRGCRESVEVEKGPRKLTITDRDIVPYNPILSQLFDCHINVEICSTTGSVKYLFKYVTKGVARSLMAVVEECVPVDEIMEYVNSRFLGASEAFWRIFAFPLHTRSPAVKALAIHLEDRDVLIFDPANPDPALAKTTELLRYLGRPRLPEFDNLTFCEYYEAIRETLEAGENSVPHPDGIHHLHRRGTLSNIVLRIHWITGG